ncbi:MAG: arylamine N-acetyltransferase [Clostridiales bacterium]|jgi:N-hydroxyarylamine O-acetyltransferase|nr:arylamine N-acetyltransferase [Clostridiales bacterium]
MLKPSRPEYYAPLPDIGMALERIGLDPNGDYSPSVDNLRKLMYHHLTHVPYENLDIYDYKRKVDFAPAHLFEKFVLNRRGGYCYEINGFFMAILESQGYDCYALSGRLLFGREFADPLGHRTTVVNIDGESYLCDVGYGSGCAEDPVNLNAAGIQDIRGGKFSVRHHDGGVYGDLTLVKHLDDGTEADFYTVYKRPHTLLEFIFPNEYISTDPNSLFQKKRIVRLKTETGSIVIDGTLFKRKVGNEVFEEEITTNKRLYEILTNDFNMIVPRLTFSTDFPREWF